MRESVSDRAPEKRGGSLSETDDVYIEAAEKLGWPGFRDLPILERTISNKIIFGITCCIILSNSQCDS